jgi:hypothetical protein
MMKNIIVMLYNSNIDEINFTGNLEGSYIKYSDSVQSSDSLFTFSNNFNIYI